VLPLLASKRGLKNKKVFVLLYFIFMGSSGNTVVEYSPHYPKVEGLNPTTTTDKNRRFNCQNFCLLFYLNKLFCHVLSQCQRQWLDSNPQLWDDDASLLPLCYRC
jgi:hypothetical protein